MDLIKESIDLELINNLAQKARADIVGDKRSSGLCYKVCDYLVDLLKKSGITNVKPIRGWVFIDSFDGSGIPLEEHHWLELDNKIIDPTADQFNTYYKYSDINEFPDIYIGNKPDHYFYDEDFPEYELKDWMLDNYSDDLEYVEDWIDNYKRKWFN